MREKKLSRNALAHLLMLAMVVIWGTMFVVVKEALGLIQPQWFNSLRMTIAFACLAVVYRAQWRQLTRTAWVAGAVAGGCMTAGFFLQTQGLRLTSATNTAFLTAMVVVLVPFFSCLPGLRPPGAGLPQWPAWTGAGLALIGVGLLTTPARTPWTHLIHSLNRGDLLALGCAVGFSLQILALDRGVKRVRFEQLTLLQVGFAMVFLTLGAWITEPPKHEILTHPFSAASPLADPRVLLAAGAAGVLATALAFSVQTWAQQVIPATNIALITTLEPVFASLTAFFVLNEGLGFRRGSGALLVLAGLLAAEVLPRRNRRTQQTRDERRNTDPP